MNSSLSALADGLTVIAALAAAAVFLFGGRVRELVITFHRWRALRRLSPATARRLRWAVLRAGLRGSSHATPPTVPGLLGELSDLRVAGGAVDDVSWNAEARLEHAREGLITFGERITNSLFANLGSHNRTAAYAEAAELTAELLASDSGYEVVPGDESVDDTDCARVLRELGAAVLAGPRWAGSPVAFATADKHSFDLVRTSERRGLSPFGIAGPLRSIANGEADVDWHGLISEAERQLLTARAAELAKADLDDGNDSYNGEFPRLLAWRVETGTGHGGRRLHLLVGSTTFYTWRVLHENASRVPIGDDRLLRHTGGDAAHSIGAVHLPVAISLRTADGYVVLRRRSSRARFAGSRLESAANGNAEVGTNPGSVSDRDDNGLVDLAAAAERELREELGPVPLAGPPRVIGLIGMTNDEETQVVYLLFEARTTLAVADVRASFQLADQVEGFHESSGELVSLPVDQASIGQSIDFVLTEPTIRPMTRAMMTIVLASCLPDPAAELPRDQNRDRINSFDR